jgi:hypothetical protein
MYLLSASENGDVEVKVQELAKDAVCMLKKGNFPQVCRRVASYMLLKPNID